MTFLLTLLLFCALFSPLTAMAQDSLITCKFVVGSKYFAEAPMSVEADPMTLYRIPGEGKSQAVLYIDAENKLTDDDLRYAVPEARVRDAALIRQTIAKGGGVYTRLVHQEDPARPRIGDPIKAFEVVDTEGRHYDGKNTLGRPLVLNFWFTGCGPCIREMPEISTWMEKVPDATFLAVTFNTPEEIRDIVERRHFRFHQIASDRQLTSLFRVRAYPLTVLIDKQGIVRCIIEGTSQQKRDLLLSTLQSLSRE